MRRISDEDVPLPGDLIEIRFPDGGEDRAQVAAFGWEGLDAGGGLLALHTDPTDPRFSLVIAGDLPPAAVPRGSEIWLVDHGPARRWNPGRGWDLLAQLARQPGRPERPGAPEKPVAPAETPLTGLMVEPSAQPSPSQSTAPSPTPTPIPGSVTGTVSPATSHRKRRKFWRW